MNLDQIFLTKDIFQNIKKIMAPLVSERWVFVSNLNFYLLFFLISRIRIRNRNTNTESQNSWIRIQFRSRSTTRTTLGIYFIWESWHKKCQYIFKNINTRMEYTTYFICLHNRPNVFLNLQVPYDFKDSIELKNRKARWQNCSPHY